MTSRDSLNWFSFSIGVFAGTITGAVGASVILLIDRVALRANDIFFIKAVAKLLETQTKARPSETICATAAVEGGPQDPPPAASSHASTPSTANVATGGATPSPEKLRKIESNIMEQESQRIIDNLEPCDDKDLEYDFFVSHYQSTGSMTVSNIRVLFEKEKIHCWTDQNKAKVGESVTMEGMASGVQRSKYFLLMLTKDVLTRPFVQFEIRCAFKLKKKMQLVHLGDFDFSNPDKYRDVPEDLRKIMEVKFLQHVSQKFTTNETEQKILIQDIMITCPATIELQRNKNKKEEERKALAIEMECSSKHILMGNRKHPGISYVTDSKIQNKISGGQVRKIINADEAGAVLDVFKIKDVDRSDKGLCMKAVDKPWNITAGDTFEEREINADKIEKVFEHLFGLGDLRQINIVSPRREFIYTVNSVPLPENVGALIAFGSSTVHIGDVPIGTNSHHAAYGLFKASEAHLDLIAKEAAKYLAKKSREGKNILISGAPTIADGLPWGKAESAIPDSEGNYADPKYWIKIHIADLASKTPSLLPKGESVDKIVNKMKNYLRDNDEGQTYN